MAEVRSQPQPGYYQHAAPAVTSLFPEVSFTASQLLVLLASLVGLAVTTPLFLLFSPVLVPAAVFIAIAVAAVLGAAACGLIAILSFHWVVNCYRRQMPLGATMTEHLDAAKRPVADMAGYAGEKTKEVRQDIQKRPQEAKRGHT
ncbi:hypothetical protein VNO78_34091 [Psophocarpus tetragonolobus]|uniref:Oleosin n=1 Tax=Psophocarpus tetragonolobus TaxID=3891 RepID=A0AAN9P364_PSOTE